MPILGAPLDFAKLEGRNFRIHQLGSAPSSPVEGQEYYNTTDHTFYWWDGTAWQPAKAGAVADATTSTKGVIQLAGDLTGTAVSPQIASSVLTDVEFAGAYKDGAVGVYSLRTIGTGALQAMAGNTRLDTIAAPTGPVSLNTQRITGVVDPSGAQDAATKNYVDTFAQGLDSHPSVRVATTANITTLAGGAPNTLDGVTLAANDRILVKDQTANTGNGIYIVQTLGTGANGTWVRSSDMDTWTEVPSAYVWVERGTVWADTAWVCTADAGGVFGTDPLNWALFSSAANAIAGTGMTKNGNTFDVNGTAGRIQALTDSIDIASTFDGTTAGGQTITKLGTVTSGVWTGTTIAIANGGTGATTGSSARSNLNCAGVYSTSTHAAGTTWSYGSGTHNLPGSPALIVQCQINITGVVVLPDITVDSGGTVTITFGTSQTANTIRTTIMG